MKFQSIIRFMAIAVFSLSVISCSSTGRKIQSFQDSEEPVFVEGVVRYNDKNVNETRERAVYEVKLQAVRRVAELFADDSYKSDGKYDVMEELVEEDPDFFIRKYKIQAEGLDRDNYFLKANVYLFPNKIASAVRAKGLVKPVSGPKAALFIEETPAKTGFARKFAENMEKNSIMSVEIMPAEKNGDGSFETLMAAAADINAEMYIKVKAKSYLINTGPLATDFFPASAEGSAEVVQLPLGRRLSDISRQGTASSKSKDESVSKAMESLASILAKDTSARVDPQLQSDPLIKLIFTRLSGLEQVENLKKDMLKHNFKYISLDSYASGKAVFSAVTKTQDTQEIASMILKGDTVGIQLKEASGKEIEFTAY